MHKRHVTTRWILAAVLVMAMQSPALGRSADYKLGYGDAITVTVVGQPSLSVTDQPVRPDGRITLPLVQQVEIEGKTVAEVTAALNKAYKPYFQSPQIVVTVARFRPMRVTVMGQVVKPGTYAFEELPTLVDAVATAGGLTDRAARTGGVVTTSDLRTCGFSEPAITAALRRGLLRRWGRLWPINVGWNFGAKLAHQFVPV